MGLSEANDANYWQSYTRFILHLTGPADGDRKIFLCPDSTSAPLASMVIMPSVTNQRVWTIADGLLESGTSVFDNSDTSKDASDHLVATRTAYHDASTALTKAKKEAKALYAQDNDTEKPGFEDWVKENYAEYTTAAQELTTAYNQWREASIKVAGPRGDHHSRSIRNVDEVNDAIDTKRLAPGLTMATTDSSKVNLNDVQKAKDAGFVGIAAAVDPVSTAEESIQPLYTFDDYREKMDEWMKEYDTATSGFIDFATLNTKDHTDTDKSHESESAGAEAGFLGIFRFGEAEHDKVSDDNVVRGDATSEAINFKFGWKHKKLFVISPGTWDVPDMYKTFPELRPDVKPDERVWYRPTQVLCVDGLSMSCTLGGTIKKTFDEQWSKHQSDKAEAGFGIMGFGLSGHAGKADDKSHATHDVEYKEATGEVSFSPKLMLGTCTMLAVIAHKVQ
ncbi:hypothetical protein FKW77_005964 [Venturia effusa]|uniref:Uncharacterized protein n=1 Tax=Venturia effusa TaxID=50376 RepID=A0A517LKB2_9PEZI|nr:hypothetical protein FKW77_005964 [Venturia effusa]